ncbi:YicC family protein [Clostridiaceae bacterium Marseille-Q4145]|nr:YicC family protein [Clostridiaceae bacterium Marseille-Q4145]
MLKSMTGFGRYELSEGERKITVEMKAVNHRYLDVTLKMPKKLNFFESAIRTLLKEYVQRGKIDVFITYEDLSSKGAALTYNRAVAAQYMDYFRQMAEEFALENNVKVTDLARCPEVLTLEDQQEDEEEIWQMLEQAVRGACEKFVETRVREGEALKTDLLVKLDEMLDLVAMIEERSPQIVKEYRTKLENKVLELLADAQMDEGRIATEVTIFADKICVDEEIVRLKSHIEAMKNALKAGGSIGRKLDFIAQEMNREANTTLSKANDLALADCAIDLKTGIEKVREQIQNLE